MSAFTNEQLIKLTALAKDLLANSVCTTGQFYANDGSGVLTLSGTLHEEGAMSYGRSLPEWIFLGEAAAQEDRTQVKDRNQDEEVRSKLKKMVKYFRIYSDCMENWHQEMLSISPAPEELLVKMHYASAQMALAEYEELKKALIINLIR
jgi:hypothetical protein